MSGVVVGASLLSAPALAGGLFLPGSGAVSTSRAGAAVASANDGEALSMNPAGLASARPNSLTISAAMIQYFMSFTRTGSYDEDAETDQAYEGTPYGTTENNPNPPLGIGKMQPIPVIAYITDFGGVVKNLTGAIGLYAPNAYPFRDMSEGYEFDVDLSVAPPPARYDVLTQEARVLFPTVALAYRINKYVDVGGRFSWGLANLNSTKSIWPQYGNFAESPLLDGHIDLSTKDNFVPAFGLGAQFHVTKNIDIGVNYNSQANINAQGDIRSQTGRNVLLGGNRLDINASPSVKCAPGGNDDVQKVCVSLATPMTAQLGARYKFLDDKGAFRGDIELQVDWQNWSATSDYRVVADSAAYDGDTLVLELNETIIRHGFQDTYAARLGGSFVLPLSAERGDGLVIRGGVGYDTAAAKPGWLRADVDGAARTTVTAGVGYQAKSWEVNIGGGAILEGTNTNPGNCNPTSNMLGCDGSGTNAPQGERTGVDPSTPSLADNVQVENPVSQGTFKSSYLLLMLGFNVFF